MESVCPSGRTTGVVSGSGEGDVGMRRCCCGGGGGGGDRRADIIARRVNTVEHGECGCVGCTGDDGKRRVARPTRERLYVKDICGELTRDRRFAR